MRLKYGIGFFAVMILSLMLITGAYQLSYQHAKERAEMKVAEEKKPEPQEPVITAQEPASVAADGQALKEDCYYLMDVNGYVVVYLSDKKTPYEYTDNKCDGLPAEMQEDAKALYGFLENYSS